MDAIHRQEFICDLLKVLKKHNFPTPEIQFIEIHYFDGTKSAFPSWLANGTAHRSVETVLDMAETTPPIPATPTDCTNGTTSQCALDILATLEEVGHRMTTTELSTEMERKERLWGESTLRGWLARLVKEKRIDNVPGGRQYRGYGFPGWAIPIAVAFRLFCEELLRSWCS